MERDRKGEKYKSKEPRKREEQERGRRREEEKGVQGSPELVQRQGKRVPKGSKENGGRKNAPESGSWRNYNVRTNFPRAYSTRARILTHTVCS